MTPKATVSSINTPAINPQLEAMQAKIRELEAEIAQRKAHGNNKLSIKLSSKGGVAVYGLGRFPTTLYKSQWERLMEIVPAIKQFIADNEGQLASKDDKKPAVTEAKSVSF